MGHADGDDVAIAQTSTHSVYEIWHKFNYASMSAVWEIKTGRKFHQSGKIEIINPRNMR